MSSLFKKFPLFLCAAKRSDLTLGRLLVGLAAEATVVAVVVGEVVITEVGIVVVEDEIPELAAVESSLKSL